MNKIICVWHLQWLQNHEQRWLGYQHMTPHGLDKLFLPLLWSHRPLQNLLANLYLGLHSSRQWSYLCRQAKPIHHTPVVETIQQIRKLSCYSIVCDQINYGIIFSCDSVWMFPFLLVLGLFMITWTRLLLLCS